MARILFYEDDFCQIEILPIENLTFCLEQTKSIIEFSEDNKAGIGYSDLYIRKGAPISLHSKNISAAILQNSLSTVIPEFEEVFYADCEPHKAKCDYTKAFGQAENVVLFYDHKDDFVKNIWLTLDIKNGSDIAVAKDIFDVLSKIGDFLIVDWEWKYIESVNTSVAILSYLEKRLKAFSAVKDTDTSEK